MGSVPESWSPNGWIVVGFQVGENFVACISSADRKMDNLLQVEIGFESRIVELIQITQHNNSTVRVS